VRLRGTRRAQSVVAWNASTRSGYARERLADRQHVRSVRRCREAGSSKSCCERYNRRASLEMRQRKVSIAPMRRLEPVYVHLPSMNIPYLVSGCEGETVSSNKHAILLEVRRTVAPYRQRRHALCVLVLIRLACGFLRARATHASTEPIDLQCSGTRCKIVHKQ
jgi:hypothetical protein